MKKLIELITTKGKSKEQINNEAIKQLKGKGYFGNFGQVTVDALNNLKNTNESGIDKSPKNKSFGDIALGALRRGTKKEEEITVEIEIKLPKEE